MRHMDEPDLPARFRAAQAYAGLKLDDAAELVGLSGRQWSRYLKEAAGPGLTEKVATEYAKLGVPRWFVTGGWDSEERDPSLAERVEALDNRYRSLEERYGRLVTLVAELDLTVTDEMRQWMALKLAANDAAEEYVADINDKISDLQGSVVSLVAGAAQQKRALEALASGGRPKEQPGDHEQG